MKPVSRLGYVSYLIKEQITEIPKTYKEAMDSSEHLEWLHAMQEELKALERNDTWEETELPPGKKQLSKYVLYNRYTKRRRHVRENHLIKRGL